MESISLFNKNNQNFFANIVRFFEIRGNKYLIFHLGEVDPQGFIKLYGSKIVLQDGKYFTYAIDDENEWNEVKNEIYKIVLNNRKGVNYESDLDYNLLTGMTVTDFKMFKLKQDTATELSNNKKTFEKLETTAKEQEIMPVEEETIMPVTEEIKPVIPENTDITLNTIPNVQSPDQNSSEKQELIELKEKYEKLLSDYENMKNENFKLVDDNSKLTKLVNDIKNIIA